MCGVVGRKNQILKLLSLLGLQAPSSQSHSIWLYSGASFSLTTNTVPYVEQQIHKSGQGLCWAPGRVWSLTSHLPLSCGIVKLRWLFMFYDWSLVFFWDLFPFFQTHEVWPLWAVLKLCVKSVNREFRWILKHLIQNSLRIQRWEGFSITWPSELIERVYSQEILYWLNSRMSQPEPHQKKTVLVPEGNPRGQGPWNSSHAV